MKDEKNNPNESFDWSKVKEVKKIKIEKDDILFFELDSNLGRISRDIINFLSNQMKRLFPDNKCVILDGLILKEITSIEDKK